jgi:hypothetical protein
MQFDSTQRRNTAPSAQGRGSTSTGAGNRRRSITAASSVLIPTRTPSGSWTICTGASKWPVKAACPRTASSMPCPSLNSCVICSAGGKPRAMRPSVRKLGSSSIPKGQIADGESPLAGPKGGWRGSSPTLRIARRRPAEAYIVMRTPFALMPFTLEGAKTCSVAVSIKQPHWMNARKSRPSAYEKKLRASRPSIERDILIRKARHAETGARIQDWLKSTGLHPPE